MLMAAKQNLTFHTTNNAPTAESVQLLRRKAAASQHVTTTLLAESSQNEAMIAQLKALTLPRSQNELAITQADMQPNLSFLNSSPSSRAFNISIEQPTQQPLTTNTTFTLSQLPALRALLADLRPRLASLRSAEHGLNSARDERRQERRDYIEQRTRIHLERSGRAHADNAMSVNGRRVDPEEVEALEKVASIFGVQ
jgi:kinetochore protein Mis12/MTW1